MLDDTSSYPSSDPTPNVQESQTNPVSTPRKALQGLEHSTHAAPTSEALPLNDDAVSPPATSNRRVTSHLSSKSINEYAASLTDWQNAGAKYLKNLPPSIAADLLAITTRSAARVIAGLPVFDEPSFQKNTSINTASNTSRPDQSAQVEGVAPTVAPSYAVVAHRGNNAPSPTNKTPAPKPSSQKPDARVIIRLPVEHPLRCEDPLLV
ncbi:Bgt-20280, partial [Blumeria graminis f. sp. tritici]